MYVSTVVPLGSLALLTPPHYTACDKQFAVRTNTHRCDMPTPLTHWLRTPTVNIYVYVYICSISDEITTLQLVDRVIYKVVDRVVDM